MMKRTMMALAWALCAASAQAAPLPALSDMAWQAWNEVAPGGRTTCSDGSPYRFFAKPGASDRLAIYFNGGGGCWSAATCDPEANAKKPLYSSSAAHAFNTQSEAGIFDDTRADNPLRGWTLVVATYCTGDVHVGARRVTYRRDNRAFATEHKGAVNAAAVLDWTFRNVRAPKQVLVTGSSAGAIGAAFHAGRIAAHYRTAKVSLFADAGGAYRTPNLVQVYRDWGVERAAPAWMRKTRDPLVMETFIRMNAKAFPRMRQSQFNNARDAVQGKFLELLGGGGDLEQGLRANMADLHQAIPTFRSYIAAGANHTILGKPEFYTTTAGGQPLNQWLADFIAGKDEPDADCEKEGCGK